MAKKYKSKKHLGVKDPYKQARVRFNKIKDKVDCPPKDENDQEMPHRLTNLFKAPQPMAEDLKPERLMWNGHVDTKGLDYNRMKDKTVKGKSPIPRIKQGERETDGHFIGRLNQITESLKNEATFKTKYNVDTEKDEKGKVIGYIKKDKGEMIGKRKLSAKKVEERRERKTLKNKERHLKRKLKKRKKVNKSNVDSDDEAAEIEHKMSVKDEVKFGEVVNAPPKLTTAHKLAQKLCKEKEGGGSFLFADSMKSGKKNEKKEDTSRKLFLEKERQLAVDAYRALRDKKKNS